MRLPIKTKIFLAVIATAASVATFTGVLLRSEDQLAKLMVETLRNNVAAMRAAEEIKYNFVLYDRTIFRYLSTENPALLLESNRLREDIHKSIARLDDMVTSQTEKDLLADLEREVSLYDQDVENLVAIFRLKSPEQKRGLVDLLFDIVKNNREPSEAQRREIQKQAIALFSAEGRARLNKIDESCDKLVIVSRARMEEAENRVKKTAENTQLNAMLASGAVLLITLFIAVALYRSLTGPLLKLLQGVEQVTSGNLSLQVKDESSDEIGKLTQAFNAMTRNLREKQEQLIAESITDELTGLHNLRYFQNYLNNEIARSRRYRHDFSLLLIDIDFFKQYNDENGHQMGNVVLKQVASLLKESLRSEGLVARYGGEEFVVCLPETRADQARTVAERLRSSVENSGFPGKILRPGGRLTISVGGSSYPADGETQQLIEKADQALYASKKAGRNRVTWSDEIPASA
jgi:diguanylate cyclase (GGDEF)-like protein